MIKNIIFDVGEVLTLWDEKRLCDAVYPNNPEKAKIAYEKGFKSPLWYEGDAGLTTMKEIASRMGENKEECEIIAYAFEHFAKHAIPNVEMIAFLREAKKAGYHCYLLSNFNEYFLDTIKTLGILEDIDGYVYSYPERIVKPHKEIYELLLSHYHLDSNECLFIDDRLANIEGAKKAGIAYTYLYQFDTQKVREYITSINGRFSLD